MAEDISKQKMALAGLGAITTLALAIAKIAPLIAGKVQFPVEGFFEPQKVKWIADQLPDDDEDEFILSAWDFVAREIDYEPVGSDIDFVDGDIVCDGCYSVQETLNRELGNCVGKSALLSSILLNKLAPDRVYMAVGHYRNGRSFGHAWVELERNGGTYLIEATQPPSAMPWTLVSSNASTYVPYATFSQERFDCLNHSFCLQVGRCSCDQAIKAFLAGIKTGG